MSTSCEYLNKLKMASENEIAIIVLELKDSIEKEIDLDQRNELVRIYNTYTLRDTKNQRNLEDHPVDNVSRPMVSDISVSHHSISPEEPKIPDTVRNFALAAVSNDLKWVETNKSNLKAIDIVELYFTYNSFLKNLEGLSKSEKDSLAPVIQELKNVLIARKSEWEQIFRMD
jgi:hypothetical protein